MTTQERKELDKNFKKFTSRHFEKPTRCNNLGQIQYYVSELSRKIDDFKKRFNYVPQQAYVLLSQYNASQNKLIFQNFQNSYSR